MPSVAQQIVPDNSLGTENSLVTPNVDLGNGKMGDRIDGGAIRGNNIFHSFQEFNVDNGQSVYFTNPVGIQNILGRVTGGNISQILGTLGVLGDANLFLLNPNGFIFGKNATLDITGSFVASSSQSLSLGNGLEFSAINPQTAPLLTVSVTPSLKDWINPTGTITNQGKLNVSNDLTLIGNNLNLEGQLQAGNDLILKATDTVKIRDTSANPFIASAGNQLLVQGNQLVDIFTLNNSTSGLFSDGDMILISHNPIITDAYFYTGGNFRLEDLNGNLGNAFSPNDPIIRATGDVSFDSYTGASLHIFAGGSVNIDSIEITGSDPANSIQETVTLSDGVTQINIDGSTQPTLDIRAGTTNIFPNGIVGDNTGFSPVPSTNGTPSSADININQIINPSGLVFLTNQDQPNTSLFGNIQVGLIDVSGSANGGSVVIDSRGGINIDQGIFSFGELGNGGDIQLFANKDIVLSKTAPLFSFGFSGTGGNISLKSQSAIYATIIQSLTFGNGVGGDIKLTAPKIYIQEPNDPVNEFIGVALFAEGKGGNIEIDADYLEITGGNQIAVATFGTGDSGDILIDVENISLDNGFIFAVGLSSDGGSTGNINIQTNDLTLINGSQINSQVIGVGDSGKININATNSVNLLGTAGIFPSAIVTEIFEGAEGNVGGITIKTNLLNLQDGGQIRASTNGTGDAGSISIEAKNVIINGAVSFDPQSETPFVRSAIVSEVLANAIGNGNIINIKTEQLTVTNGGLISASINGTGNAGDVNISATKLVSFDGVFTDDLLEESLPSRANVAVFEGGTGQGGTLTIKTPFLSVTNGAQIQALTEAQGDAGNIQIFVTDKVFLSGADTGLFSDATETSTGNAGSISVGPEIINGITISVEPQLIEIKDGATISVDSRGTGIGGNITVIGDNLTLDNQGSITATTASTDGGNIALFISDLVLLRRGSLIATDAGTALAGGNGGNINIETPFIVAPSFENSDITANAFFGNGGNIEITTNGLFGIEFREEETSLSDITASSEFGLQGTVNINNPDEDPSSKLAKLSDQTNDPSDQVRTGCAAAYGNSFTLTGRGGLPEDPTATIRGETVLSDLREFTNSDDDLDVPSAQKQPSVEKPQSIVQVKGWIVNQNGEVELVATLPQESLLTSANCQALAK